MADADIKKQRDRFLAFAFASSDLFLEADENGAIIFSIGASKSLTGIDPNTLSGRNWMDLFAPAERIALDLFRMQAKPGQRCGPIVAAINPDVVKDKKAIITGILMPGTSSFYITLGFPSVLMESLAELGSGIPQAKPFSYKKTEDFELLDKDSFIVAAQSALDTARALGQDLEMTLLDIADAKNARKRMGDDAWTSFTDAVTDILGARSVDGHAVAKITDGRFSIIHDASISADTLKNELKLIAKDKDPEGKGFDVTGRNVSADLQSLSERETMKALIYTINEFERKGTALNIDNLNTGFKTYVSVNAHKIQQFKTMVSQLSFDFEYQPIVDLKTYEPAYFEMLSRFRQEGSTREWVAFAEDINMAADFEIAVCERAVNYLLYKSAGHGTKFAVNLTGQSMQNEQFFKTLLAKLTMNKSLANRLIFEITDSAMITQLDRVNNYIKTLQSHGFKVCLDDFGAAATSLQYLQRLQVDYAKIDGQYTQKILDSEREAVVIRSVAQMCRDLNIVVIAERIEEKAQVDILRSMGVVLGQGYYFAYPANKPTYEASKIKAAASAGTA